MSRHKRIVFIVVAIMLFTSSQLLFADFMSFDLKAVESGVTQIEYRLGKDSWQEVDMNTLQIQLPRSATDKTLQLRLYGKNKKSSVLHNYRYDDKADTWVYVEAITEMAVRPSSPKVAVAVSPKESVEVTLSPYATVMLTDNVLRHMYTLPVGVGLDASLSFPFHRDLIFKADVEVKFAKSNNIWADSFILFGGDVGLGYRFLLGGGFKITPSLSYGLYLHHGFQSNLEKPLFLTHHVGLDVEVGYQIGSSLHVLAAPHVQMMIDNTRNGFLYGLRAGVGFTL